MLKRKKKKTLIPAATARVSPAQPEVESSSKKKKRNKEKKAKKQKLVVQTEVEEQEEEKVYIGVYKSGKRYESRIMVKGKFIYLGRFDTALEADRRIDQYLLENPGIHKRP